MYAENDVKVFERQAWIKNKRFAPTEIIIK